MIYSRNLALAEMAVKHVENCLPCGADNKEIDLVHRELSGRFPTMSVDQIRNFHLQFERMQYGPGGFLWTDFRSERTLRHICGRALIAKTAKQARCAEQAGLALDFLIHNKEQTGLGLFSISAMGDVRQFDHSFVVLGLDREPLEQERMTAYHYPCGWTNAVWCDPWAHEWFAVKDDWPRRMRSVLRLLPGYEDVWDVGVALQCFYYHGD